MRYNKDKKELRPFIEVLIQIENMEYFALLTSPKPKHLKMRNTLDFFHINHGTRCKNFPVVKSNYTIIDLNKKYTGKKEIQYQELLNNQYTWLNEHKSEITNKANKLYQKYKENKLHKNIKDRCCNYLVLEEACLKYNAIPV